MLQRELRPASPDEPRRDGELVMIGEELPGRPGSSEVVDHGYPDERLEAERPDLADQLAAPELELALEHLLIRGRGHLFERHQAVTRRAARSRRSAIQGPVNEVLHRGADY